MPSSYTTTLRLELQATGENRTTWGTLANQVFSDVDAAIAGRVNIAMSDANYTLTANNGTPDEARYMILNVTGALTATRSIIVPSVSKVYVVENNTTGSQSLNIRTSTNTTQALVPPGRKLFIGSNGSVCYIISDTDYTSNTTWTGRPTFQHTTAPGIIVERTNAATNSAIEFKTTGGSVFAGHGAAGTFAIDGDGNLASVPWFTVSATGATNVGTFSTTGAITAESISLTGAGGINSVGNLDITSAAPIIRLNDTTTLNLVHRMVSSAENLLFDCDLNGVQASSQIRFAIDGNEAMRISPFGDVAVNRIFQIGGISSGYVQFDWDSTTNYLRFQENGVTDAYLYAARFSNNQSITGIGSNVQGFVLGLGASNLSIFSSDGATAVSINRMTSNGVSVTFRMDTSQVGNISVTGSNTAYNTSSDERLKTFGLEYDPDLAIAMIRADPVKNFTWNYNGQAAVGWSAQASYLVNPDFATPGVGEPGDEDWQPWGMDYSKRVPFLWAALTKALDRIDALEARVLALENP